MAISPALQALMDKLAERKAASSPASAVSTNQFSANQVSIDSIPSISEAHNESLYHHPISGLPLNDKQSEFIQLALKGQSCVLIGAAGTGKTFTVQTMLHALIQSGMVPKYEDDSHAHLKHAQHGIIINAFTRRAVANIRKNLSADLAPSCLTVHAALEFQPEFYETMDPVSGEFKNSMKFIPTRDKHRPLSDTIHVCIIEEASMLGTELYRQLREALSSSCIFIFLGDIQQLPPVFGPAILGFKMIELPVIELTEVYRQAFDSPIISLAHRILSGNPMPLAELGEWNTKYKEKGLQFHPLKKRLHPEHLMPRIAAFFKSELDSGKLNTDTDVILMPFNKALGTIELNKEIAQHLTKQRGEVTHEIIAGFIKHYLAIGDRVLHNKEDAIITEIKKNPSYIGVGFRAASHTLDRWGYDTASGSSIEGEISADDFDFTIADADALLAVLENGEDRAERKNDSSHIITLEMLDGTKVTLNKSAEINQLLLAYALTVHKSQGSEWRKVYCVFHQSHNTMIARELLYTAVTRAREELYIICEPDTFVKGIIAQKVPGNCLADKIEYFKGKLDRKEY